MNLLVFIDYENPTFVSALKCRSSQRVETIKEILDGTDWEPFVFENLPSGEYVLRTTRKDCSLVTWGEFINDLNNGASDIDVEPDMQEYAKNLIKQSHLDYGDAPQYFHLKITGNSVDIIDQGDGSLDVYNRFSDFVEDNGLANNYDY